MSGGAKIVGDPLKIGLGPLLPITSKKLFMSLPIDYFNQVLKFYSELQS